MVRMPIEIFICAVDVRVVDGARGGGCQRDNDVQVLELPLERGGSSGLKLGTPLHSNM